MCISNTNSHDKQLLSISQKINLFIIEYLSIYTTFSGYNLQRKNTQDIIYTINRYIGTQLTATHSVPGYVTNVDLYIYLKITNCQRASKKKINTLVFK